MLTEDKNIDGSWIDLSAVSVETQGVSWANDNI